MKFLRIALLLLVSAMSCPIQCMESDYAELDDYDYDGELEHVPAVNWEAFDAAVDDALKNKVEALEKLLDQGQLNPAWTVNDGVTLESTAISELVATPYTPEKNRVVRKLLKAGALPTPALFTVLRHIALDTSPKWIDILIQAGADPNAPDPSYHNLTPLLQAINSGKNEYVDALIKYANLNKADELHGMTPLMFAAKKGNNEIVAQLLQAGAQTNIRNKHNETAAEMARHYGHSETAQLIEEYQPKLADYLPLLRASAQSIAQAIDQDITHNNTSFVQAYKNALKPLPADLKTKQLRAMVITEYEKILERKNGDGISAACPVAPQSPQ